MIQVYRMRMVMAKLAKMQLHCRSFQREHYSFGAVMVHFVV